MNPTSTLYNATPTTKGQKLIMDRGKERYFLIGIFEREVQMQVPGDCPQINNNNHQRRKSMVLFLLISDATKDLFFAIGFY